MNREEYFQGLSDFFNAEELKYVQVAYWLVKEAHRRQFRRLTGERFFEHVRRVSWSATITYGYQQAYVAALGLLHDVIEDTFVPMSVILNQFGNLMYRDVMALSKEIPAYDLLTGEVIGRTKKKDEEYDNGLATASHFVKVIKGCDRLDNTDDLVHWEPLRREKYIIETESRILPLVDSVDDRIANDIRGKIELAKAHVIERTQRT